MTNDFTAAVITGASSGIGEFYAEALAPSVRDTLVLVARRQDRLEQLAERLKTRTAAKILVIPCDLTNADACNQLVTELQPLGIDCLINNAGFGSLGSYLSSDIGWEEQMVALNCLAPVRLTRALLPNMVEKGRGAIVNVCSVAAYQPMPYMATYGATKAFLLSHSVALSAELKHSGVRVQALCPGPTPTEFHLVVGLPSKLRFIPSTTIEQVVEASLHGLQQDRAVVIPGWLNASLAGLNRVFSRRGAAAMVEGVLRSYREHQRG